nr:MAG TPA: hypothetical protein [Caudoviricetes sp.]
MDFSTFSIRYSYDSGLAVVKGCRLIRPHESADVDQTCDVS